MAPATVAVVLGVVGVFTGTWSITGPVAWHLGRKARRRQADPAEAKVIDWAIALGAVETIAAIAVASLIALIYGIFFIRARVA